MMKAAVTDRLKHVHGVLLLPVWQWIVLGSLALLGAIDTVRSDIYGAIPAIPHLPARWWIIILLMALLLCIFEASFRLLRAERSKKPVSVTYDKSTHTEGGTGGELTAYGSGIRGSVTGGEGAQAGEFYKAGAGGSAEVSGIPRESRDFFFQLRGGTGGSVSDGTGRGAPGARSPLEEMERPTSTWTFGSGGDGADHPELKRRVDLLERFINDYYIMFPNRARFIRVGIDLMPESWVNKKLEEAGEAWRVVQKDGRFLLPRL